MEGEIFEADSSRITLFAELLLPVPIPKLFTYRIPYTINDSVKTGQRAIVQFGDRKVLTGIIINIHSTPPADYEAKLLLEILDEFPIVSDLQLKLFTWIADYYMCTLGEVMTAGIPSGLKLSSESMVQLNPAFDLDESDLPFSEKELILLTRLKTESLKYSDIAKLLGIKNIYAIIKSLTRKESILLYEEVKEKYRPKTERRIRLQQRFTSPEVLEELFTKLSKKPKQEEILLKYLQEVHILNDADANKGGLSKKQLLELEGSESSIKTLVKNKVFEEFEMMIPRFETPDKLEDIPFLLSEDQERAQAEIFKSFEDHGITLLHGVTGSGKTEIYINLIRKALDSDAQVLYLLPEIALTTQIVQRLKKVFGNSMGVYHSRFSDNERVEVWNGILNGSLKFIVGVRSSVFLPFDSLGLIIVDEEHEPSYKQQEPAPRYHARDAALMLGRLHHAKVLLGSATPSIESYFHASQNKYGLVKLDKRFGEAKLPQIILADMTRERRQKTIKGEFSGVLLKQIDDTLNDKDQVIIFQNRRGYSPMISCEDCGWIPKCTNCAVSLTYHQFRHSLICHYCGYKELLPTNCPTCSSTRIKTLGYGTEKLEEELKLHFEKAHIQRMDLDTTRTKSSYETIIDQFQKGETNILVGTQMVTKGLDFNHVNLVGVFNADRMMHFPDFRSYERAYQLITQVSGRAGRRDKPGKVVIQTSDPDNLILKFILNNNFLDFYNYQIKDRKEHNFPPYSRLIEITVKHLDKKQVYLTVHALAELLRSKLPDVRISGPGEPVIAKIRNQHLMTILVKVARNNAALPNLKDRIQIIITDLLKEKEHRNCRIIVDVDPA